MGTNYYHVRKCLCCQHEERIHIGKSSGGWCFALHVYRPEDDFHDEQGVPLVITSLDDWKTRWKNLAGSWHIEDEYGEVVTREAMKQRIQNRGTPGVDDWHDGRFYRMGYAGKAHFHRSNNSQRGPNGLLRHRIDGRHCVGHGEGTWDYLVGTFS